MDFKDPTLSETRNKTLGTAFSASIRPMRDFSVLSQVQVSRVAPSPSFLAPLYGDSLGANVLTTLEWDDHFTRPRVAFKRIKETLPSTYPTFDHAPDFLRARDAFSHIGRSEFIENEDFEYSDGLASHSAFFPALVGLEGAMYLSPVLLKKILALGRLKINWDTPKSHLWIGASTTIIMSLIYSSFFLVAGKKDQESLWVLLGSLPVQMTVGGLMGSLMYEVWTNSVHERYLRSLSARLVNRLGLQNVVPALSDNEGMPNYKWMSLTFRGMILELEAKIALEKEATENLQGVALGSEMAGGLESLNARKGDLEKAIKMNAEDRGLLNASENVLGKRCDNTVLDSRYLTFLGASMLTVGTFFSVFGKPEYTSNIQALMIYFAVSHLALPIVTGLYGKWFNDNIWEFVVRPKVAGLNKRLSHFFGADILPGALRDLAKPEVSRNITTFNRIELAVKIEANRLRALLLQHKATSSPDENKILQWSETLKNIQLWLDEVNATLHGIHAR